MIEVREVLRGWLCGVGLRVVAAQAGVDRKTARRYIAAAQEAGLTRESRFEQVTDEVVGAVVASVRPARPAGHGSAWQQLTEHQEQITEWVEHGLTAVKIGTLLGRRGVDVPYRTLHRFVVACCGFGRRDETVRVADGEPGVELQLDFGNVGTMVDAVSGRKKLVRALIFTVVYSRHMFVWLSFSQKLDDVIAGCEAAWVFFGGVFKVLVPDNMSAIVADADPVNPKYTNGWLDYAQHCGFVTDAARGAELLLPVVGPYDVPLFKSCKVHRDFHLEIGKALYSVPRAYLGQQVDVRADSHLVKVFWHGQLIKTHPRQRPGGRLTDPDDLPAEKVGYAMRDLDRLIAAAGNHGPDVGIYAQRLLDDPLPWTRMRAVYRLLGLARRYGDGAVNAACGKALDVDVVSVTKIDAMLQRGTESNPPPPPRAVAAAGGRFARDPGEFAVSRPRLRVVTAPPQPSLFDEAVNR